jgi:glycine/D-amino acid oxidase-like deaminating enzyme
MSILSEKSPITFQDALPEAVDVVVIGAGVIGISTAWFLAKSGLSVLVCEKGRVAGEQSSRNWGWVRKQGRDEAEVPIAMKSLDIWEELSKETGEDLGFTRQGLIFLAEDEKDQIDFENWMEIARRYQLDTRMLSATELGKQLGYSNHRWKSAMHTPSDARAEPFIAVPGIARAAQSLGVKIIENCAVRSIDSEAGVVAGVLTETGKVRANAVVCAGGAWSSAFLANLGVRFPQLLIKGTVVRTTPVAEAYAGGATSHNFSFRRRQDGGYTLSMGNYLDHYVSADSFRYFADFLPALKVSWPGMRFRFDDGLMARLFPQRRWQADETTPFEQTRVLNPGPNPFVVKKIERLMSGNLPVLGDARIEEAWAGMIDAPPDFVPVMDELPAHKNFYIATGFSGHGFGIGPGAGYVMAKMVQGQEIEFDLSRFRFSRFSDGSPVKVGPAL